MTHTLAFIGGGRMGEALLAGALRGATKAGDIVVIEPVTTRAAALNQEYGVHATANMAGIASADIVVIAVKPDQVATACEQMSAHLSAGALVISVAAGVTTSALEAALPSGVVVVRVMPNTPAFVGEGMSVMSAGSSADAVHLERARHLLESVGKVLVVPEDKQDAVTALSGSGPAYFFYLVEAMIEAGVQLGLTRDVARELAVQTSLGAATLMSESGEHPVVLRENVMSPGGTTAAAIRELEARGVRGAVYAALDACAQRSADLAR